VYALHMSRTNIEIDDELMRRVMERWGFRTKREAVDRALRRLDLEPMTDEELAAMEGSGWDGDLDELRRGMGPPA
jgi:Arc/MetJ family transcription regulator